jgi:predicted outer membrane repeat protein
MKRSARKRRFSKHAYPGLEEETTMRWIAHSLSRCFRYCAVAVILLGAATPGHATNYHVGSGVGCTHATIQAAINAAMAVSGSWPKIYIATNKTYLNQAISISPNVQSHITLIGGVPSCISGSSSGNTTINGSNPDSNTSAGTSVITVRGAMGVTLSHLTITGGKDVIGGNDDAGGGIDYAGVGYMNIGDSTIDSNTAVYGGGIRFQGNGGAADLYINANTFITSNTAQSSGGGIRVDGNASLHIDAPQTWIAFNKALGSQGGGVLVVGPAYAHIGSPGYLFGPLIYQNTAPYGGGIALISQDAGPAQADLFASDPTKPVRVEQNRASQTGGGVYLLSDAYTQSDGAIPSEIATLQMEGARIDDNAAQEGSGIYADSDFGLVQSYGSDVYMYTGASCGTGTECNSVSGNRAVTKDAMGHDVATAGSAILIQSQGVLRARQLAMRGSPDAQGAHAIRVVDSLWLPLLLDTCLIADNNVSAELLTLGNASATINQCTIANNRNFAEGYVVLRANADLTLTNSIFAQGSQQTLFNADTGANMTVNYVMSGETASLGPGTNNIHADPEFVDPGNGDFHLRLNSPGVDVAPAVAGDDRDLDNLLRDQDLPEVSNLDGNRDLGAYERQLSACDASDTIFCNGFES